MGKYSIVISLLILCLHGASAGRTFECTYMRSGRNITQVETQDQMIKCRQNFPNSCECKQVATKCTYGPDDAGEFIFDQVVPDGTAAKCDKVFCICTSHENYHQIVAERIQAAESKLNKPETGQADQQQSQGEQQAPVGELEDEAGEIQQSNSQNGNLAPQDTRDNQQGEENQVDERDISKWQQDRERFSQRSNKVEFPSNSMHSLFIECFLEDGKTMMSMEDYKNSCQNDDSMLNLRICQCDHSKVFTFQENVVVIQAPNGQHVSDRHQYLFAPQTQPPPEQSSEHVVVFTIAALALLTVLLIAMLIVYCKVQTMKTDLRFRDQRVDQQDEERQDTAESGRGHSPERPSHQTNQPAINGGQLPNIVPDPWSINNDQAPGSSAPKSAQEDLNFSVESNPAPAISNIPGTQGRQA